MPMWFLEPKAGIARSTRKQPSSRGLALVYLIVQRASRSLWRSLAGFFAHSGGTRSSVMSRFSPSVLRCLGAATIEAAMIWPLPATLAPKTRPPRAPRHSAQPGPRAPVCPRSGRASALRERSRSYWRPAPYRPAPARENETPIRQPVPDSRSRIRYSVRSSDRLWLACRMSVLNIST
jgi:hypothetical protein